jgi:hypothetical protein
MAPISPSEGNGLTPFAGNPPQTRAPSQQIRWAVKRALFTAAVIQEAWEQLLKTNREKTEAMAESFYGKVLARDGELTHFEDDGPLNNGHNVHVPRGT